MKTYQYSLSVGSGFGRTELRQMQHRYADWLDGEVITYHGIVSIYAQGDDEFRPSTQLTFVWKGRMHVKSYNKRYTQRGIVTLAKRFANEIVLSN
jgi:hypothetical protein